MRTKSSTTGVQYALFAIAEAILALLNEAGEAGLTRKQLWDKPPEAVKRNEPRTARASKVRAAGHA